MTALVLMEPIHHVLTSSPLLLSTGSSNVVVGSTRARPTISTVVLDLASSFELGRVATDLYHASQSRHHWHGALLQALFWVRCRVPSPRFLPTLRRELASCRSHVTLPRDGKRKKWEARTQREHRPSEQPSKHSWSARTHCCNT